MRLELADGQWAELRERLTYGQAHGVRAAYFAIESNPQAKADLDIALVRAYISNWHVLDVNGQAVSLDTPEQAPDDVIQAISQQAADLFGMVDRNAVPKAGGQISPATPPASASDPINGSQTYSFSTDTPDGPTLI